MDVYYRGRDGLFVKIVVLEVCALKVYRALRCVSGLGLCV